MSGQEAEGIIAQQRASWDSAAESWERWNDWFEENMAHCNLQVLDGAGVGDGQRVLDLGSGTGHPSIGAARRVGDGQVLGLDLAPKMVEVARRQAREAGLTNIEYRVQDVSTLPFEDESFDAVTSRFCLMFLPKPALALAEARRVLRKGGRFAALVWSAPQHNPGFTLAGEVLSEFVDLPKPDPGKPGPFALAQPGSFRQLVEEAGFQEALEEEVSMEWTYESGEQFFQGFRELSAPLRPFFDALPEPQQAQAKEEIIRRGEAFRQGERLVFPGLALLLTGKT